MNIIKPEMVQFVNMMKNGNPEQMMMSMLEQSAQNNPILENLLNMAKNNDSEGIESYVRNVAREKGIDYDKEFNTIIQNFKKPSINVETKVINPIQASNLEFNNISAEQVKDQITSTFIYTNINKFLQGTYHITNENQIKIIAKSVTVE